MTVHQRKADSECTIAGMYDLSKTIGKGHFAVVKLARHVFTGEKVAVKVIDKAKLDPVSRDHLFQEVRCMKLVQHPHIVRLYEVIDTQTKLYLILELGDGDMYDYIINNHGRGLDVDTARVYFTQILEAISYCHDLHVVHRDLKPENVIFFERLGLVKLTDFGFSNRFEPDTKLDTSCGSLAYSAPEILLGDSYDAPAVDVWSLGVLLYMLVCGEPPFQEANDSETLTMIMDCRYRIPSHIPPDCASLISAMLKREPRERMSLSNIVNHRWMIANGRQCCDNSLCVSLVGREHLPSEDQESIIQKMVDGGIATRAEIYRALESDEYSNVTATFYLLAERKLKKNHADEHKPVMRSRPSTTSHWPPRLEHSLSTPEEAACSASEQITLEPSPKSAPYDQSDNVFSSDNTFLGYSSAASNISTEVDHIPRKFSLINEEDEESDTDDLTNDVQNVKESRSVTGWQQQHKKKLMRNKTQSGSDTSDNDEDSKHTPNGSSLNLPHKRKDSGNSSDNDGPPGSGCASGTHSHLSVSHVQGSSSKANTSGTSSPCAKKKYGGTSRSSSIDTPQGTDQGSKTTSATTNSCDKLNSNGNNKDCDNSLRVLTSKFVDSSLSRLSNFSLASLSSSISSRSSNKYSANTTPRSSQRRSKDANKFSKTRLMQQLKMDFSELSDRELTDSDCGSLHNSLRVKISTCTAAGSSVKEYSVITEEQGSPPIHTASKKTTDCCSIM
ncbi:SNF-related serine/threonine-protein kinase-like isoform X3 [Watersipora subatra]|uniref:SNF-related serine/threonine-protein kinase-like isoform X3 n=1 Tax=Watersipora subatra TaxID=2589382 RepID=UPI00355BEF01